jgi:hypothetical protein
VAGYAAAVTRSRWSNALLALLLVHLLWGLARTPSRALARRGEDIAAFRRQGDAAFLFADAALDGADAILWLRAHTPPGARIAWRGADRGAIEFAAALLWPRLLVAQPPAAGEPVLVATRTALTVEHP